MVLKRKHGSTLRVRLILCFGSLPRNVWDSQLKSSESFPLGTLSVPSVREGRFGEDGPASSMVKQYQLLVDTTSVTISRKNG